MANSFEPSSLSLIPALIAIKIHNPITQLSGQVEIEVLSQPPDPRAADALCAITRIARCLRVPPLLTSRTSDFPELRLAVSHWNADSIAVRNSNPRQTNSRPHLAMNIKAASLFRI